MEHTPGPWTTTANAQVTKIGIAAYLPGKSKKDIKENQSYYVPIAQMDYGEWQDENWLISKSEYQANAHFIIRACNTHEDLLKACQTVIKHVALIGHPYHEILKQAIAKAT